MLGWLLRIILGVVGLVIVVVGALYALGSAKLNKTWVIEQSLVDLQIPTDKASIARGKHFAIALGKCVDCHGADLGGKIFIDAPPFLVVASNLTRGRGGVGANFADADFVRAIRHGVDESGHGLIVMPAEAYTFFSDQDLADIIAYVKSVPPVDRELPDTDVKPLGRILLGAGQLMAPSAMLINHDGPFPATMPPAASIEYGRYLAMTGGCMVCHGAGLSGGRFVGAPPSEPTAQNITPTGIGSWSDADLERALRVGKRPDSTTIDPFMPWQYTALMTDQEMKALVLYLRSVPPRATGTL
jgi:mono/diheme cytochrome c family protein